MTNSVADVTTNNMELTPMRVTYNGVDLGGTLGNVVVNFGTSKADILADQSGKTVRDRRISAQNFKITTEIAEIKNKDNWKVVFPHFNLVTQGGFQSIYANAQIGASDLAVAQQLVLHPLSLVDADTSGNYLFYKAVASEESEITYGPEEQARLKIVWNVYPDDSVSPERFFLHGDPTIGLIAAVAGAPSFTGTGNGTMTAVTVYNGVTKTETITATCVTAVANAGVFAVSGSLSGALGLATVGVSFVPASPDPTVISFTINDGTTDFTVGAQFTVATTAANYV